MGMMPWNSASRPSFTLPRAESPSTIYSSRWDTSLVRQSTNFCTRLEMSTDPDSFFLMPRRVFSAVSRDRLFTSTWPAIFSASKGFSMKYTSSWLRRKSVMASWMNLLVMDFLVWFS